jgi:hypothetical protein
MSDSLALQNRIPTELMARATAVVGLLSVAIVHILDLHGTLEETPLVGYGYFVLIAVSLAAAALLMTVVDQRLWALVGVIAASALLAYVLSRTTGIPGDSDDVGNWNCALGTTAISTEAAVVLLAGWRMRSWRPARPTRSHLLLPAEAAADRSLNSTR